MENLIRRCFASNNVFIIKYSFMDLRGLSLQHKILRLNEIKSANEIQTMDE